jgi:hypothetical protein
MLMVSTSSKRAKANYSRGRQRGRSSGGQAGNLSGGQCTKKGNSSSLVG